MFEKVERLKPSILEPEIHPASEAVAIYDRLLNDRNFPLGVIFDWTAYHTE